MTLPQGSETYSSWMPGIEMPRSQSLATDIEVDICIVGAGISGLTAAYLLMKEGKKVCIVEHGGIASGQTAKTSAHVSNVLGHRYFELENMHGKKKTALIAESHTAAIKKIKSIAEEENINCDIETVSGYLFQSGNEASQSKLEYFDKELAAAHSAGLTNTHFVDQAPIRSTLTGTSLCFPDQLAFHPLKYLKGLSEVLLREGAYIYTHTQVVKVEDGETPQIVTQDGFTVTAQSIVVATNSPINNLVTIHTKQAPYRTYVVGLLLPKDTIQKALFWDTEDPYHYVRIAQENSRHDVLIVGGEDHKTGQNQHPEKAFDRLVKWAQVHFPVGPDVLYRWSGQVMETTDGIGFMGRNPGGTNVYIISGDSGNGLTNGTIGAMIITDLIAGRQNAWADLYSPARINLHAVGEFIKENANVALQYKDWFTGESFAALEELSLNEGIIIADGLKKIAAYKTGYGEIKMCSAVCPHLGGIVAWNAVEKSWDCPCHGSRFTSEGKVIEGPATESLKPLDSQYEKDHLTYRE
ncbi:MAG: FAD-dependent oxidoreductase [Bdellovibrionota bacterium]